MLTVGHTATAGWGAPFPAAPPTFDEVPPAAHDPKARLEYMDSIGVWAQVMYPNVGGFGNQAFLALDDPELQLACVRAYNDWLTEWCATDPTRLLAITATPFWDVDATVAEIERCAALGHRGILFTGEPQQFGLPLLGDRSWDPLWRGRVRDRHADLVPHRRWRLHRAVHARSASPRTASRPRT